MIIDPSAEMRLTARSPFIKIRDRSGSRFSRLDVICHRGNERTPAHPSIFVLSNTKPRTKPKPPSPTLPTPKASTISHSNSQRHPSKNNQHLRAKRQTACRLARQVSLRLKFSTSARLQRIPSQHGVPVAYQVRSARMRRDRFQVPSARANCVSL
jgi:hypothetical protein